MFSSQSQPSSDHDDVQKYGTALENILGDTKMMKAQLDFFYNSLDIGRWL